MLDWCGKGPIACAQGSGHQSAHKPDAGPAPACRLALLDDAARDDTLPLMAAQSHEFEINTRGNNEVLNITEQVASCVSGGDIACGVATVFVIGSTAGITTTEFEPGLVNRDLKVALEGIAPEDGQYLHEQTWNDDNGHSHVRASLIGPSLTVPVVDRAIQLGTWQQIILLDFDTRGRTRRLLVQVVGE